LNINIKINKCINLPEYTGIDEFDAVGEFRTPVDLSKKLSSSVEKSERYLASLALFLASNKDSIHKY